MPDERAYLRYPSIQDATVVFVADNDVFLVPSTGGVARRLTSDHAPVSVSRLCPDGSLVAYTARRNDAAEVYVVARDGSPAKRLTFWGDRSTRVLGWDGNDRVIATSAFAQPFASNTWAYSVSIDGGGIEQLNLGPITGLSYGPSGAVVVGVRQNPRSAASWKRYRGGTAASLWIDEDGSGVFVPFLAELNGQLEDPMFVGDRVAFVSDHEGFGNIYSAAPDGSSLRRHSDHSDFYARAASSDGTSVVYQCGGEICVLSEFSSTSTPTRIAIELGSPRTGRTPRQLRASEELGAYAPDQGGRASAVAVRGTVHWLTHRDGPSRRLGGGNGERARLPRVLGSSPPFQVVFVTDAEGDDALQIAPASGDIPATPRRLASGLIGRVLALATSPDGTKVAVASHDGRVIVADVSSGETTTVDKGVDGDASGLCFSPDSVWLAWSHAGPEPLRNIKLAAVDGSVVVDATPLRFVDRDPVFSLDGKYLCFLSERTFDPIYDSHVFDLSFASATRPYLITLDATTASPFDPQLEGRPGQREESKDSVRASASGGEPESDKPKDTNASTSEPICVSLEGLGSRVVPFPVTAGRYSSLRAGHGGMAWKKEPLLGVLGEQRSRPDAEAERPNLIWFDFDKRRDSVAVDALDRFEVSGDGRTLVVRDGENLRAVPAGEKVSHEANPGGEPEGIVNVDLSRVRVELDPPTEWRQMYEEAARLMRDHFWVQDMAGVDWDVAVARYRPLLDQIATRDDLSEILWEVQGELGTSHAYETPPGSSPQPETHLGFLGTDLTHLPGGEWQIARILPGETSVPSARSPLLAPGVVVSVGDVIVAVDSSAVDNVLGPAALLLGAAGKPVELRIRPGTGGDTRRVVVQPLDDERPLRYQAWVADRRSHVHTVTTGRVGYVHIPDMMGNGWAQLHRDLRLEVTKEALIVDVRYNGGGHVSELVLEKLSRTVLAWDVVRHKQPETYPSVARRGPLVAVTNEWAGSDGDIVTAGFRQRGLGPVVGTRTWGGVIGIDSRYQLVDGTTVTQPRYAFWFQGFGWGIENYGVEPDVEVPEAPQDWAAGTDPQLDKAIELALEALATQSLAVPPDPATRPSRTAPALPPRPESDA